MTKTSLIQGAGHKNVDQKKLFLEIEGDQFHFRNRIDKPTQIFDDDLIIKHFKNIRDLYKSNISVADVGCGQGGRIGLLKNQYSDRFIGIDPSSEAINEVNKLGIEGIATADDLPFHDKSIDVLIYSFRYICAIGRTYLKFCMSLTVF